MLKEKPGYVWSAVAIDYDAGLDITDVKTGKQYTDEEAKQQPQEIKSRLVMRPRKIGTWVKDIKR